MSEQEQVIDTAEDTTEAVNNEQQEIVTRETTTERNDVETSNSEVELLKQQLSESRRAVDTERGKYGMELTKLKQSINSLQDMNAKLVDKLTTVQAKPAEQAVETDFFKSIAPDVAESIGDDTAKHLMKWVVDTTHQVVKREVSDAIHAMRANIVKDDIAPVAERSRQSEASINQELFLSSVEKLAPGFRAVNGNQYSGEAPNPKWDAFLNTPVPDLDITWLQFFENSNRDPRVAASAFKKFSTENSTKKAPVRSIENQVAPNTVKSGTGAPTDKTVLKKTDFEKFKQEIYSNPTKFAPDKRDQLMNEYCIAALENRLV